MEPAGHQGRKLVLLRRVMVEVVMMVVMTTLMSPEEGLAPVRGWRSWGQGRRGRRRRWQHHLQLGRRRRHVRLLEAAGAPCTCGGAYHAFAVPHCPQGRGLTIAVATTDGMEP